MSQYCFALGCDRSGTTALVRLLHAHEQVVMGVERYKYWLGDRLDQVTPPLFEAERFLDFEEGDTNITPQNERFTKHYEIAAERLRDGDVRYIGDKVVAKVPVVRAMQRQFPSPKLIFIYRDLFRVASSFCVRARNPDDTNWPADSTHLTALNRWTGAFDAADALLDGPEPKNVFVVRYEGLFNGDERTCTAMFHFLDLDYTPEVRKHFTTATAKWDEHESKELQLSENQLADLRQHADSDVVRRFDREFERQVDEYAST
jgi:hypothetical protein